MKLDYEGDQGTLARHPDAALDALMRLAELDGADPDEWLAKALNAVGVTEIEVPVTREPRFQAVDDVQRLSVAAYRHAMVSAFEAIRLRLEDAARDPAAREV